MHGTKLATLLVCMALIGCGGRGSGPTRYHLSGTVTFDGKPVPAGTIYFEPASGPAGSAEIKNGYYDTRSGKGVVGGQHRVLIEGFDGNAPTTGGYGKPIFRPFRTDENLPTSNTTKNFDVPKMLAEGLVVEDDPA